MEKKQTKWAFAAMLLLTAFTLTSCCKDPDPIIGSSTPTNSSTSGKPETMKDSDAGSFVITNLSANEEVKGGSYNCFAGDTLKVDFLPKQQYKSLSFTINTSNLIKLSGNLFLVPDLKTSINPVISISKNVTFQATNEKNSLYAEKTVPFFTYVPEADVSYTLIVSPDLLQFVNVELEYTTDNGTVQSKTLSDKDWIRDTSYIYVFTNDVGHEIHSSNKDPHEGHSLTDSIPVYDTYFDLDIHYGKLDSDHKVTARYTPKMGVEPMTDTYKFWHNLMWGPATIAGASITHISLDIGGSSNINRQDVASYLEKLSATPDVVSLHLNKRERKITEKK